MSASRLLQSAILGASLVLARGEGEAKDVREELDGAVESLLSSVALKGRRVAVGQFADSDKGATGLGDALSEEMESLMVSRAKPAGATVVSRRNMQDILKEWDLSAGSYVEEETASQIGKLVGAQIMCLGRYSLDKKTIRLKTSLVSVESGEILGSASAEFKLPKNLLARADQPARKTDVASVAADLGVKEDPPGQAAPPGEAGLNDGLKVEVWSDKPDYKIGEKMRVSVRTNRDGYLTLINVGTSGSAAVIFPNHFAPSNAVKAGVTYTIPDPAAGFDFEVGGPAGTEIIRAIASKAPAVDLRDAMESFSAQAPFGAVRMDLPVLTRNIQVKAKKAARGDWSEAVLKLAVRP